MPVFKATLDWITLIIIISDLNGTTCHNVGYQQYKEQQGGTLSVFYFETKKTKNINIHFYLIFSVMITHLSHNK